MPLSTTASLATLLSQGLAAIRVRLPGKATDLTSYLGAQTRAWAMGLFGLQRTAEAVDRESPPNQKTSELGIITWADTSGVPSNLGGYGRNGAIAATGGVGPVTGTGGVEVLSGQQLVADDGVTIFELVGNVTIPASGSFRAVTKGEAGNLEASETLTWLTPPTGCAATVVLSSPLTGGEDIETIDHLFGRLRDRWQAPPKGGANIDYKEWCEAMDGVDEAFVYPLRGGTTTVHIVITAPGTGSSRVPVQAVIDAVQARVTLLRPAHVNEALVMAGSMPAARGLTLRASAFLATGYSWDWDDTGGSWAMVAYSGAGPITLEVNNALPQSLKTAIDNGDEPLIQIINTTTGAPVVVEQVAVTAYSGLVLTLKNALTVAPTAGDEVWAGSYAATLAAQEIFDFVNGLGPSRASGFADIVSQWEAIASVWGCGDAALQATDSDDSTRLLSRLASVNGLTIQVGDGAAASTDFEPQDLYTTAPEIARAARIIVVQAAA